MSIDEILRALDVQIGSRLRQARTAAKLSQRKLGACAGLTKDQVRRYELGENRLSAGVMMVFAEVLGVSTDWMLTGKMPSPAIVDVHAQRAAAIIQQMPPGAPRIGAVRAVESVSRAFI
ncbi:helix-turn-helix domain-containing protein [Ancylobacter radicis]|uniref:Helix-turn-helix transcriptional regulator n=1 Tax=Ancylobacter radicis TaxID=2836179 RepID=A0ABS5R3G2_9HYPH|nr:helix-turn-helix transcriptional regulator [Ancylobacter radicis]MBS9476200.1 helix-turn-helix transcriptional regulator [Ancylobacter radicis]